MASVQVQPAIAVDSANRIEPGSFPLPAATLPDFSASKCEDPDTTATAWVDSFNQALEKKDTTAVLNHFHDESYWRDQLCLSWEFHTLHGTKKMAAFFKQVNGVRIKNVSINRSSVVQAPQPMMIETLHCVNAFLVIETDVGRGGGIVQLVQDGGSWKAFTMFTFLKELIGHEEITGKNRLNGYESDKSGKSWLDSRKAELELENGEPTVLVVGAGQAGLAIAARLRMLGVKALIVDQEERVGDNWRLRYHSLVLHDPVWFDHLPYLSFPSSWPVHSPKDKIADWLESYASTLELNIWTSTSISRCSWDDTTGKWTIDLTRTKDGKTDIKTIFPKHVVQATGHSGEPYFPSDIKGIDTFAGTNLVHSSKFKGASPSHGQNKKAIVVGACNSGHDIAKDFYEKGYSVTMVQRSSTYVVTVETSCASLAPLYSEDNIPTEVADTIFLANPNTLTKRFMVAGTKVQNKMDEKLLDGLIKAGFNLDTGVDGSGLWMKYILRGGGYYLDSGCSQLIVDGKIKVKQGQEISEVLPQGIKFTDGEIIEADEIVFATGYLSMRSQCRKIFGDKVADRVKDVWGMDEEGETRGLWRNSGHPGFWFMAGNLLLCRWYSGKLALQIKAREEGLY